MNTVERFDDAIDRIAARFRGCPPIDRCVYILTEAANHSIIWHLVNVAMFVSGRHSKRDALRLAVILGMESALVNGFIKRLFRRQRPLVEVPHPHRLRTPKTTSFPSGHATSAFCAASVLSQGASPQAKIAWFGLAKLVSWTRIHVRIHHASDVAAGALLGLALGSVAKFFWPKNKGNA